ncbi:DNRLRE domain-containing protein [Streptomyces niveus]
MSSHRQQASRRRARFAAGAALLLVAEAALVAGGSASAAPVSEPRTEQAKLVGPSEQEIWESDLAWAAKHTKGSIAWAVTQAKKTGKKTVATDETTPTTYTVANPDGTLTTELTAGPERVWKNGAWKKADATLTEAADGSIASRAHPNGLRLGGRSGTLPKSLRAGQADTARDLVTLGTGDSAVTLQWKGGLPKPELDGTRARYKNAVPGADVIVEATRTGFEQFVELGERPAGAYTYTLPVKAKGLKAKANKDGSVTFTDARTGAERATMPAPVMWDSAVDKRSGEHTNRARVDMKVIDKGAGQVDLVVTPDAGFLADPDTKFPVTVDPSTSALASTFDTYVQQGETVDWSNDVELDLGNPGTKNPDGTPRSARSFIHWNTTPIQDALIVDTNLALWNFHSGNTDCTAQEWTVWDTTAASTSSRWTNQPTWNQQYHSSTQTKGSPDCTATQPDGWINADVDALVQSWASAKATRGFMGLRAVTDDTRAWKRVNSANNTTNQPKLSVTYNYRPSDGTDRQAGAPFKSYAGVWAVNNTTPTLRDTFTDVDGDTVNGTFQVYDAATDTPITTPAGEGLLVSGFVAAGKPASVTVPAGQLKDGKTYKFRTNAYDGTHYNLNWSPWTQFVVDTTAPNAPDPVNSAEYPEGVRSGSAGTAGTFTAGTDSDANRLQYRVNGEDADPDIDVPASGTWSETSTSTGESGTSGSFQVTPEADGRHQVDTRAVDRADNVGSSSNYGFYAGPIDPNRGGHKVDITLNKSDLNAVQPAPNNEPQPAYGLWQESTDRSVPQPRTFTEGGKEITIVPLEERDSVSQRALALSTQAAEPPLLDKSWCDPNGANQKSLVTLTEACLLHKVRVTFTDQRPPVKTYGQDYELMYQVKVDAKSDSVKHWFQYTPLDTRLTGTLPFPQRTSAIRIDNVFNCADGCTDRDVTPTYTERTPVWDSSDDKAQAWGSGTNKWNGSVLVPGSSKDKNRINVLMLMIKLKYYTSFDTTGGTDSFANGESPDLRVRCDNVYSPAGCVVDNYRPGFVMNSKKYPAAAAHAWLVQNKTPNAYGRDPIHLLSYLPPVARNSANSGTGRKEGKNRYQICNGKIANKMVHPSGTAYFPELDPRNNRDNRSCDEYPFNSTYESAGMPRVEGGKNSKPVSDATQGTECIQTHAPKLPDGTFKLYDNLAEPAPTWTETCGRSSMSLNVNSGSMNTFGSFATAVRLIDDGAYWVQIKGFEDCDPAADVVKCAQRP